MTELEMAMKIIAQTDRQIAVLFEERMKATGIIAGYKKEHGLAVYDAEAVEELINRNVSYISDDALRSYYISFLQNTEALCVAYQHRLMEGMRIAYSGVPGAFAEIAAKKTFPDAVAVSYADFADAYAAVENGECDCAMLPVENSNNGDVGQVMDLAFFGDLHINGMYDMPVTQNLLACRGADITQIREVMSHSQALGQCSEYISRHGWTEIRSVNTAVAAQIVAESGRGDIAAIGSLDAADKYGLQVLESHIESDSSNTTRFAVFAKSAKKPAQTDDRFVMAFTVNNVAGSLGRAVGVIGEHGYNLRALKSRPTKKLSWDYYFYAEGDGNLYTENGRKMLDRLSECCNEVKIIGYFENEVVIK